ncbi:MAG: hypothetical protein ACRD38_12375 [Nitrososphaerales archaeon]
MDEYTRFVATMILFRAACRIAKIKRGSKEEGKLINEVFDKLGFDKEQAIYLNERFLQDVNVIQRDSDIIAGITKTETIYTRLD